MTRSTCGRRAHLFLAALAVALTVAMQACGDVVTSPLPSDVTLENGRGGGALMVQDPDQYLLTPTLFSSSHPDGLSAFTMSFWYMQVIPGAYTQILLYEVEPSLTIDAAPLALFSYLTLTAQVGDNTVYSSVSSLFDSEWHHVAIVWDSEAGQMKWYIDAVLVVQQATTIGYRLPAGGYLTLGKSRYSDTIMYGALDEFAWFTVVLADADRLALSTPSVGLTSRTALMGAGGIFARLNASDVAAYYSFDQNVGDTSGVVVDESPTAANSASIVCTTHCLPTAIVGSTVPAQLTNDTIMRLPANRTSEKGYLVYLARTAGAGTTFSVSQVRITSLPAADSGVTLLRANATNGSDAVASSVALGIGSALAVGDVLTINDMPSVLVNLAYLGIIARVDSSFGTAAEEAMFTYDLVPLNASLPALIGSRVRILQNHAPSPAPPAGYLSATATVESITSVILPLSVDEEGTLSFFVAFVNYNDGVQKFAADADADAITVYCTRVPTDGTLAQADGTIIANASRASPVLITAQKLSFTAPLYASLTTSSNMTAEFFFSDGHETSTLYETFNFTVNELPHLPTPLPLSVTVAEDSLTIITIPVDSSNIASYDSPYLLISSLPVHGKLYQVNADGSADLSAAIGDTTDIDTTPINQWVSTIYGYSSAYYDSTGAWNVTQLIGAPNWFPSYGDNRNAWAGLNANEAEWVEFGFDTAVFVSTLDIYETYNPGHVSAVYAWEPTAEVYHLIWSNPDLADATPSTDLTSKVTSPAVCPMDFATNRLKLTTSSTGYSWVELDAIRTIGAVSTSNYVVRDPYRRVAYQAPSLIEGDDSFNVTVSACEYYQRYRQVGVASHAINLTITPVNHAPSSTNLTSVTSEVGVAAGITLSGSDPDPDPLKLGVTFQLASLPSLGVLRLVRGVSNTTSTVSLTDVGIGKDGIIETAALRALTIRPVDTITYESLSACDYEEQAFLIDAFSYVAVDFGTPPLSSEATSVTVEIYCLRTVPLSSVIRNIFIALAFIGVAACIGLCAFMIVYREEPVVKASSIMFNMIALLGCCGLYLSLLPLVWDPLNDHWCMARWALPCIGFTLLFSSVFAKTRRIFQIFTNKRFTDHVMSNWDVFRFVLTLCTCTATVLLIYFLVDPPRVELTYKLDPEHTVYQGCSVSNPFRGILFGGLGGLLVWGTILSIRIRDVPSQFNETTILGVTIYNSLLVGALGIAIDFAMDGNMSAQAVVRCFLLFLGITVSCVALFGTKVAQLVVIWYRVRQKLHSSDFNTSMLRRQLHKRLKAQAEKDGKTPKEAQKFADEQLRKVLEAEMSAASSHVTSGGGGVTNGTGALASVIAPRLPTPKLALKSPSAHTHALGSTAGHGLRSSAIGASGTGATTRPPTIGSMGTSRRTGSSGALPPLRPLPVTRNPRSASTSNLSVAATAGSTLRPSPTPSQSPTSDTGASIMNFATASTPSPISSTPTWARLVPRFLDTASMAVATLAEIEEYASRLERHYFEFVTWRAASRGLLASPSGNARPASPPPPPIVVTTSSLPPSPTAIASPSARAASLSHVLVSPAEIELMSAHDYSPAPMSAPLPRKHRLRVHTPA